MVEFNCEEYLQQVVSSESIEDCPKVPIPSIGKNQNYLFISYSHKDYKAVYSDLANLYDHNVRFWYDRGLRAGKDWEEEVCEHIKSPNCCGVIFYLSTNMFLSDSIIKEIEFTQTKTQKSTSIQKNYFCVNLHGGLISDILFDAQQHKREMGLTLLNTEVQNRLTSAFSDKATYLMYASKSHIDDLLEQIHEQFDVIDDCPNRRNNISGRKVLAKVIITLSTAVAMLSGLLIWQPWSQSTSQLKDKTAPTVYISNFIGTTMKDDYIKQGESISFTVEFSDNVGVKEIDLLPGSILLSPGLIADIEISGSGNTRMISLNNIAGTYGAHYVTIPANVARDAAGNHNFALKSSSFILQGADSTIPTINIARPTFDNGAISFVVYTADDEQLQKLEIDPLDISTHGFIGDIEVRGEGNSNREIIITNCKPIGSECYIEIAEGVAVDTAGNKSKSVRSHSFDISKPALTISAPSKESITAGEAVSYTITTADNVQVTYFGIHKDDIKMVGFTADIEIVEKDDFVRQIIFSNIQPTSTGIKYFVVAEGVAKDALGNGSSSKNSPAFKVV